MNINVITKFSIITILVILYNGQINTSKPIEAIEIASYKNTTYQTTTIPSINYKTYQTSTIPSINYKTKDYYQQNPTNIATNIKLWQRLRNNFSLNIAKDNEYIKYHLAKYQKQNQYLQQVSNNASPYLPYIIKQLEYRNMPGELALLPMIESSFNPHAISNMGATGIWQLQAATGRHYGLKQNAYYDDRKNVVAATNAALSYLQYLHAEFNGDWLLALAAYNAGEGRIKRAINKNLAENKPTDFWSLSLPKETKHFVPKLLALANLVKNANIEQIVILKVKKPLLTKTNIVS